VNDRQLGALIRAARHRRSLRQQDLARLAGIARSTVSDIEAGNLAAMSLATLRRVGAPLQVEVEVNGRWRGADGERLLSRRHSGLAESVAQSLSRHQGWTFAPEVSFSIYGERGIVDQIGWHEANRQLLVIELKTEFVDVNEMLGTLDRKARLAPAIAAQRGWRPAAVSVWLIVADSRTNRRHAAEHSTLLRTRFSCDGRSLAAFLRNPAGATSGLAFWTDSAAGDTRRGALAAQKAVRLPKRV
jgi:transcriptional regulator with XRE-family HTH domain